LDVALAQRPVGEQQLAHRRCLTPAVSVCHLGGDHRVPEAFRRLFFSFFSAL
jgi:hypothetical protein